MTGLWIDSYLERPSILSNSCGMLFGIIIGGGLGMGKYWSMCWVWASHVDVREFQFSLLIRHHPLSYFMVKTKTKRTPPPPTEPACWQLYTSCGNAGRLSHDSPHPSGVWAVFVQKLLLCSIQHVCDLAKWKKACTLVHLQWAFVFTVRREVVLGPNYCLWAPWKL